jgi:pyruvate dehydrogenase E2 component (dihydrolipoamide acetyltransferase)
MDEIMKLRKKIIDLSGAKISINDMFIKACAMALKKVPEVNSQWNKDFIRKFTNSDIAVAVSTDAGLITPIIFNADRKNLNEISKSIKELADRAKAGKLKPHEFQVLLNFLMSFFDLLICLGRHFLCI